jgi:hypothetical protein
MRTDRPAAPPDGQSGVAATPLVISALLVVSLLPWRYLVFYSGGVDPVVVAKAAVGAAALGLACLTAPAGALDRVRPRTFVLVALYLMVGLVGALGAGGLTTSLVLAVRVAMVAFTVLFLVVSYPPAVLVNSLSTAMGALGLVLGASGVPDLVAGTGSPITAGRLAPALIPVGPNELALLFSVPILVLVWRMSRGGGRGWHLFFLVLLVGLTLLTGSRTGLLALALGVFLLVVLAPRINFGTLATVLAAIPVLFFVVTYTATVSGYFDRGGNQNLLTLSSRTVAWQSVFSAHRDFYGHWFGGGLAVKTVAVNGPYSTSQVVDSSWVSTYIQTGLLGVVLLTVWVIGTVVKTARAPSPFGRLWLALAVFALVRSFLATGLLDTYVLFVVMLVPALQVDLRGSPHDQAREQSEGQAEQESAGDVQQQVPPQVETAH